MKIFMNKFIRKEWELLENIKELWDVVLNKIEEKVSKPSYETWLQHTVAEKIENNTLTVMAPNEFAKDWLEEQYTDLIASIVEEVTGSLLKIKFSIPDTLSDTENIKSVSKLKQDEKQSNHKKTMLNPKYVLNTS